MSQRVLEEVRWKLDVEDVDTGQNSSHGELYLRLKGKSEWQKLDLFRRIHFQHPHHLPYRKDNTLLQ